MGIVLQLIKYTAPIIVLIAFFVLGDHLSHEPEEIRNWIMSSGVFAPIFYVLVCAIRPFFFFPFLILTVTGGLVFGPILGIILTTVGGVIGASFSFIVARKYGDSLKMRKRERWRRLEKRIEQKGFQYILILRVFPFLNFDLVSYASGLSSVRFKPFFLGTLFGMLPGTIGLNLIGDSIVSGEYIRMLAFLAVFMIIGFLAYRLVRKWKR
ncbi:TVP38/TMEM64 family protein [Pseudalkalibacillus sp. SCS-8]|uniref:TVP38/TMEM64 family protein n=1 Tax=Pseudalkalibacillus nanhaiensis TaxID=3115291 RepID=UPI0032DA0EE2